MKNLAYFLNNFKISFKHKVTRFHCLKNKPNKKILFFFLEHGLIESFANSPFFKKKYLIYIAQFDILSNYNFFNRSMVYLYKFYLIRFKTYTYFKVYLKQNKYKIYNLKKLKKLKRLNDCRLYILSTSKGILSAKEAIKYKKGGILLGIVYI